MKPSAESSIPLHAYPFELRKRVALAAGAPANSLRFWRIGKPARGRVLGATASATSLISIACGVSGIAPLLKLLNELAPDPRTAIVVRLEASSEVLNALAGYAQGYTSWNILCPRSAMELFGGTCCLIGPQFPMLIVASVAGSELVPIVTDAEASSEATLAAVFESAGETFGARSIAVVLSGAGAGLGPGLRKLLDWGGTVLEQSPATAIDGSAVVEARAQAGLVATSVEPDMFASRIGELLELNS